VLIVYSTGARESWTLGHHAAHIGSDSTQHGSKDQVSVHVCLSMYYMQQHITVSVDTISKVDDVMAW